MCVCFQCVAHCCMCDNSNDIFDPLTLNKLDSTEQKKRRDSTASLRSRVSAWVSCTAGQVESQDPPLFINFFFYVSYRESLWHTPKDKEQFSLLSCPPHTKKKKQHNNPLVWLLYQKIEKLRFFLSYLQFDCCLAFVVVIHKLSALQSSAKKIVLVFFFFFFNL